MRLKARTVFFIGLGLGLRGFIAKQANISLWGLACLGGLRADHVLGVLGVYPLLRGLRLAVSLLQRVTFADAQK
jgi:thiamine pyrophosphokinase